LGRRRTLEVQHLFGGFDRGFADVISHMFPEPLHGSPPSFKRGFQVVKLRDIARQMVKNFLKARAGRRSDANAAPAEFKA
jgi:hypothetical protein